MSDHNPEGKSWAIVIAAIITAIVGPIVVWYVTNQQAQSKEQTFQATVSALQTQIAAQNTSSTQSVTLSSQAANYPTAQPTLPQPPLNNQKLPLSTLRRVLDETSTERVEVTLGRLRELCNQGQVICYDHPTSNWSVVGPALIATDPLQQPIVGARVVKVNRDSTGNWLPDWPIGLFYIPANQTAIVPTPGVAYPLETTLPTEWIVR